MIERGNLVLLAVAHGQDHDGHAAPFAETLEHFHAVEIGQAEIEQHHVRTALGGLHDAVVAGRGIEDAVAVRLQRHAEQAADLRLVINDQGDGDGRGFLGDMGWVRRVALLLTAADSA